MIRLTPAENRLDTIYSLRTLSADSPEALRSMAAPEEGARLLRDNAGRLFVELGQYDTRGEGEVLLEMPYHDMKLTQQFAVLNRKAMVDVILNGMGLTAVDIFTTIHNYIDTDAMILRKGSVSAKKGEKLLIPINMRDGSLICIGTGNEDWNCSAPHGAGRLMSRRAALNTLSMEEFQNEMKGIYTTCVVPDTLDESPMAYKSIDEIVSQIGPTAIIVERIRPVYNFKASD